MRPDEPQTLPRASLGRADFLPLAETLPSPIALIQGDRLVYLNPAGCALLGRSFWEVVHPDDRKAPIARIAERLIHADAGTIWMGHSVDLLQIDGEPTTRVTRYDVTQQRRIQERLQHSEARLAEARQIGHIGSWEWEIATDKVTWSAELCRIYGVEPAESGSALEGYLEVAHPEDRAMAREVLRRALARGGQFAFEHRVVCRDGRTRTIFGRVRAAAHPACERPVQWQQAQGCADARARRDLAVPQACAAGHSASRAAGASSSVPGILTFWRSGPRTLRQRPPRIRSGDAAATGVLPLAHLLRCLAEPRVVALGSPPHESS